MLVLGIRIVAGLIGLALLAGGISFALKGWSCVRRLETAFEEQFIHLDVDLSRTGEYRGAFRLTFSSEHGQALFIKPEPPVFKETPPNLVLKGLRVRVSVLAEPGEVRHEREFKGEEFRERDYWDDRVVSIPIPSLPEGSYELVVRVEEGAPGMGDVRQTLVGKYVISGADSYPGYVRVGLGCLGFLAGIIALFLAFFAGRK